MRVLTLIAVFSLLLGGAPLLLAQVTVQVEPLSASGIALVDGTGTVQSEAFPVGVPYMGQTVHRVSTNGTGSSFFIDYVETEVTPPSPISALAASSVAIESRSYARKQTTVSSLYTAAGNLATPGTQTFRITLSAPSPTPVVLDMWGQGRNLGNASIATTVTFGANTYTWTWMPLAGFSSDRQQWPVTVNGTMTLDVTITGSVTPGPGGGTYHDGYDTRWSFRANPITTGSVTYWGAGCGPATLSHTGNPVSGQVFSMQLGNIPAGATSFFALGTRTDVVPFLGLTLPYDFGQRGAPGCTLYVGSPTPFWLSSPVSGPTNTLSFLVPTWVRGTYHVQGVVLDPNANGAGLWLTRAATINF